MANRTSREYNDKLRDATKAVVIDRVRNIADSMVGKDGLVFGDIPLSRRERILSTLDAAERGVLAQLALIDRAVFEQIVRQLDRDLQAEAIDPTQIIPPVEEVGEANAIS